MSSKGNMKRAKKGTKGKKERGLVKKYASRSVTSREIVSFLSLKEEEVTVTLRFGATLTSTAGGILNDYYSLSNPTKIQNNATNVLGWTQISPIYDTYMPRELALIYRTNVKYDPASAFASPPGVIAADFDNVTVPVASLNSGLLYQNCKYISFRRDWEYRVKCPIISQTPSGQPIHNGGWLDTGNPSSLGIVSYFSGGLTASTTYGYVIAEMTITFRGRKD